MKKRHWKKYVLVFAVVIIAGGMIIYSRLSKNLEKLVNEPVQNISLQEIEDGSYEGDYKAFPVTVKLNVEVKDHKMVKIAILKHDNGKGKSAEEITGDIIEKQSLDVDIVSGATYSSKVILKAVEDALVNR
ncbi:FMN-binding protein [Proteiniclasticum sp.]|uniref:FMN-binding protein n=1 Tax=Proteiniclasticum sp. TaxID=2053595 RepID=UPI0028963997|nr:FMN-binding protein [Proteiniclasticum sp.]